MKRKTGLSALFICGATCIIVGTGGGFLAGVSARAQGEAKSYSENFTQANSLLRESKYLEALSAADGMIRSQPDRYEGYYLRAYACFKLNKQKDAEDAASAAESRAPEESKRLVARLNEMVGYAKKNRGKHFPTTRHIFRVPKGRPRSVITGVVIDARGMGVERAMDPKIRLGDDSEVWGTKFVDPDYVIAEGIVAYTRTLEEAETNKRCGRFPLVFKAVSVGKRDSDVVLSPEDAKKLLNAERNSGFLTANQVIFVIDH